MPTRARHGLNGKAWDDFLGHSLVAAAVGKFVLLFEQVLKAESELPHCCRNYPVHTEVVLRLCQRIRLPFFGLLVLPSGQHTVLLCADLWGHALKAYGVCHTDRSLTCTSPTQTCTLGCDAAQVCELRPGEFVHTVGDAHVYANHVEPLKQQLLNAPRHFPRLVLNPAKKSIDDFVFEDFELIGYSPHKTIKMQMAV